MTTATKFRSTKPKAVEPTPANDNEVAVWDASGNLRIDWRKLFWGKKAYLKQMRFIFGSKRRYQMFLAGRGAGKTYALIVKALWLALMNPGCAGAIFGRTLKNDVRLKLYPLFQAIIAQIAKATGLQLVASFDSSAWITTLINGAQIYWLPYGKLDSLEKNRGLDLAWAVLDEIEHSQVDPSYAFDVIDDAVRNPRAVLLQVAVGTTPKGLRGVVAKFLKAKENKSRDHFLIHATSYDNPHLSQEEIVKREKARSKRLAEQEIKAIVLRPSNVVFREFSKPRHSVDWHWRGFKQRQSLWGVGIDWGTTKGHVVFVEFTRTGRWIIFDEMRFDNVSRIEFRNKLNRRIEFWSETFGVEPHTIASDRAITDENALLRRRWRKKVTGVIGSCSSQTEQEIIRGVGYIQYMLEPADDSPFRLAFAKRLDPSLDTEKRGVLGAFLNYRYVERTIDGVKVVTNQPWKDEINDDQIDALRYLVVVSRRDKTVHGGTVLPCIVVPEEGYELAA